MKQKRCPMCEKWKKKHAHFWLRMAGRTHHLKFIFVVVLWLRLCYCFIFGVFAQFDLKKTASNYHNNGANEVMKMFSIASYCIENVILIVFIVIASLPREWKLLMKTESWQLIHNEWRKKTKQFKLQVHFVCQFHLLQVLAE